MPVVDASVVIDWIAPGAALDSAAMGVLVQLTRTSAELLAPRLLMEEVGNALLTGVRRGRWAGSDADAAFSLVQDLPVALQDSGVDLERAWDLSRRYDQHPLYDMIYVALAERTGSSLITADERLRRKLVRLAFVTGPEGYLLHPPA
jgi:predicted nucleic acid-binding protein